MSVVATSLDTILEWRVTAALGWALLQFVWQGAAIGVLLGLALVFLRNRDARERYALCVGAMLLMLMAFGATFVGALRAGATPSALEIPFLVGLAARVDDASRFQQWLPLWLPWITLGWGVGAMGLQARLFLQWRYTCVLRTRVVPAERRLQRMFDELHGRLGMTHAVRVAQTTLLRVPAVVGWWKPIVLVPLGLADTISGPHLRAILAHELAHVRRHDPLVNWVQGFFESLLFFHPAVWWVSRQLRAEREYCCDDIAVMVCGDALSYARALSTLAEVRDTHLQAAVASTGGSLMLRITRLFSGNPSRPISRWSLVAFPSVLLALGFLAASCNRTPVETTEAQVDGMETVQDAGNHDGLLEVRGLEHPEDASVEEKVEMAQRHLKQLVADGAISKEDAHSHWKHLTEQLHEVHKDRPEAGQESGAWVTDPTLHNALLELHDDLGEPERRAAIAKLKKAHLERAGDNAFFITRDEASGLHVISGGERPNGENVFELSPDADFKWVDEESGALQKKKPGAPKQLRAKATPKSEKTREQK